MHTYTHAHTLTEINLKRCTCIVYIVFKMFGFIIVIFLFTAPSIEAVRSQLAFGISCNEPVRYVLRPVRLKFIKGCGGGLVLLPKIACFFTVLIEGGQ